MLSTTVAPTTTTPPPTTTTTPPPTTTTTPPPDTCCEDNGFEDSPLPEWGSDWGELIVYCPYPIDEYRNCYQYVVPTITTTPAPTTTTPPPTTTTTPPPDTCCEDNGFEDSPLPEWGSDWVEVTVYCPYPIDEYRKCYQRL